MSWWEQPTDNAVEGTFKVETGISNEEKREQLSKRILACIVWHEVNHTTLGDVTNDIMREIEKQ
jgi:hypothetical protein